MVFVGRMMIFADETVRLLGDDHSYGVRYVLGPQHSFSRTLVLPDRRIVYPWNPGTTTLARDTVLPGLSASDSVNRPHRTSKRNTRAIGRSDLSQPMEAMLMICRFAFHHGRK